MSTLPCRVVVCAEDMLVRVGIHAILADQSISVIGGVSESRSAVALVARTQPDVVVSGSLDVAIQIATALQGLTAELPAQGGAGVLALITPEDEGDDQRLLHAVRVGVHGMQSKNASPEDLGRAVCAVANGSAFLTPWATRRLLDWTALFVPDVVSGGQGAQGLSDTELKVLLFLAHGMLGRDIAHVLGVTDATVRSHVHHLLTKLGARNRVQAVAFAYRQGIVRAAHQPQHPAHNRACLNESGVASVDVRPMTTFPAPAYPAVTDGEDG